MEQQAVSRVLTIGASEEFTPDSLALQIARLVEALAERLSVRGVVPGHIKAMVEEAGGEFAMFNCTRPGSTRTSFSGGWEASSLLRPVLRLSIILVGLPGGRAEAALKEVLVSFKGIFHEPDGHEAAED